MRDTLEGAAGCLAASGGCLFLIALWLGFAWLIGWLASLALGAFGVDVPVWACVILIFILGGIFGGSSKR